MEMAVLTVRPFNKNHKIVMQLEKNNWASKWYRPCSEIIFWRWMECPLFLCFRWLGTTTSPLSCIRDDKKSQRIESICQVSVAARFLFDFDVDFAIDHHSIGSGNAHFSLVLYWNRVSRSTNSWRWFNPRSINISIFFRIEIQTKFSLFFYHRMIIFSCRFNRND